MVQVIDSQRETPSQTCGPYVHIGCIPTFAGITSVYAEDLGRSPVSEGARGRFVTIAGSVFDGTGWALRDAMIESWQADAAGVYPGQPGADPAVRGFCRLATGEEKGGFELRTVKPGAAGGQAPHIALWIVARGINVGLSTRIYFPEDDHARDPVLSRIEQRPRAKTLVARPAGKDAYRFDICLQGENETVFLDM